MDKETSRRLLLFGSGSLLFLLAWYHFFPAPKAQPQPAATAAVAAPATPVAGSAASSASSTTVATGKPADAIPAAPRIAAEKGQSFTLKSGMTTVVFNNQGAGITSWQIDGGVENHAQGVELVHPVKPVNPADRAGFPLDVAGEPAAAAAELNGALWQCAATADAITCDYASGGLVAQKKLALRENLLHEISFTVTQNGAPINLSLGWGPGFGRELSDDEMRNRLTAVVKVNLLPVGEGRAKPVGFKKDELAKTVAGPLLWYGVDDNFYGALFVPKTPVAAVDASLVNSVRPAPAEGVTQKNPTEQLPQVHGPLREGFLFVGPKKYPALQQLGHSLEKACGYDSIIPFVTTATVYLYHAREFTELLDRRASAQLGPRDHPAHPAVPPRPPAHHLQEHGQHAGDAGEDEAHPEKSG